MMVYKEMKGDMTGKIALADRNGRISEWLRLIGAKWIQIIRGNKAKIPKKGNRALGDGISKNSQ